jgi:predicted amidohydrolase YtcJ
MRARLLLSTCALAALTACAPAPREARAPAEAADAVYVGAHILTMDPALPSARSLAVRGERIVCVAADDACAEGFAGARRVALGARALLPGFVDAHGHVTMLATFVDHANLSSPPVGSVTSIATLQDALRARLAAHPPATGEWLFGWGYDDSLLAERRHPTRDDLDAVSRDVPIAILHVSAHLAVANGAALAFAGVSPATPDPPGGHFRRREGSSEPNGVMEEAALYAVLGKSGALKSPSPAQLARALGVYAANGFTLAQDGASGPSDIAALEAAAAEGALQLDVVYYPIVRDPAQPLPAVPLRELRGRVAWGGMKLILDGSPQGKTAFLTQPYFVPPPGQPADYRGYPMAPQPFVDAALARFLPAGIPVIAHANGDAAEDMLIEAVARAVALAPGRDHRTVMIHAQTVRDDQLDRMKALGMIPSFFSAHAFYWGDWHRDSVLGPERAARISPTRSAQARGLPYTIHNDAPVVPPDAIRLLWATTNRLTRSGKVLGPAQRATTLEALRALTTNGAYQYFAEKERGSLSEGKLADLVVLSHDPLALPRAKLLELKVEETVSRGKVVFEATAAPGGGATRTEPTRCTTSTRSTPSGSRSRRTASSSASRACSRAPRACTPSRPKGASSSKAARACSARRSATAGARSQTPCTPSCSSSTTRRPSRARTREPSRSRPASRDSRRPASTACSSQTPAAKPSTPR